MYGYIYKTTNLINNKFYIGKHKCNNFDPSYLGSGVYLWNSINKYGIENFRTELLVPCFSEEELNAEEEFLIEFLGARDRSIGYNIAKGGVGGSGPCTEEKKAKISASLKKGRKLAGSNNPMYGVSRRGISYGYTHSEETKEKIREKAKGRECYWKGKHLSEETKDKLRESHLRENLSKETRDKMSRSHSKPKSELWKESKSKNMIGNTYASNCKGITRSDESKERYRKAAKNRRWINKDGIIKSVQSEELDFYLNNGWKRGRKY